MCHFQQQGLKNAPSSPTQSGDTRGLLPSPRLRPQNRPDRTSRAVHAQRAGTPGAGRPSPPPTPRSGRRSTCSAAPRPFLEPSPHGPSHPELCGGSSSSPRTDANGHRRQQTLTIRGSFPALPQGRDRQESGLSVEGPGKTTVSRLPVSCVRFLCCRSG